MTTLSEINAGRSNKYQHNFLGKDFFDVYELYFKELKDKPINILEIGVYDGHSLNVWKEYFTNVNICGIDIDPTSKRFENENINIFVGDQKDTTFLQTVVDKYKEFDIIIDDGSHVNDYTIKTYTFLIDFLKSGGIYVIEDLHCCYLPLEDIGVRAAWPGMVYNDSANINNDIQIMYKFFNNIFDNMNNQIGQIISMQFWSRICFLIKG